MKLIDIAKYSLKSLTQRQIRSWLTMLGIVIGIAAVVSLLTIGQGFNEEIEKQLSAFGSNTIFIAPISEAQSGAAALRGGPGTSPSTGKLFEKDVDRLKKIAEIEEMTKIIVGRGTVGFKEKQITATVQGIEPGIFEKTTLVEIENGRFLVDSDQRVAVIGASISEDSFGNNKVGVNSFITVNGKKFRVIGILKKSAGGFGPSSQLDTAILIPAKDAQSIFKESLAENEISAIVVKLKDGSDIDDVTDKINQEIANSHKVRLDEKDFSVLNPKIIQERIGAVVGLVTVFLGAVAAISLLVGGIGIANTMFTSVLERTHEIGVLKAVGATRSEILKIFVFESAALGGIGGLLGTFLGGFIAYAASTFGVPASIKPEILLFALAFSIAVGLGSGFVPARRAADLSPVDALRYE